MDWFKVHALLLFCFCAHADVQAAGGIRRALQTMQHCCSYLGCCQARPAVDDDIVMEDAAPPSASPGQGNEAAASSPLPMEIEIASPLPQQEETLSPTPNRSRGGAVGYAHAVVPSPHKLHNLPAKALANIAEFLSLIDGGCFGIALGHRGEEICKEGWDILTSWSALYHEFYPEGAEEDEVLFGLIGPNDSRACVRWQKFIQSPQGIRTLLEMGAHIGAIDEESETVLHKAVGAGDKRRVNFLMRAMNNDAFYHKNNRGREAYSIFSPEDLDIKNLIAGECYVRQMVFLFGKERALVLYCLGVTPPFLFWVPIKFAIERLIELGADVNMELFSHITLLQLAIAGDDGNEAVMTLLPCLRREFINRINHKGYSVLHTAASPLGLSLELDEKSKPHRAPPAA